MRKQSGLSRATLEINSWPFFETQDHQVFLLKLYYIPYFRRFFPEDFSWMCLGCGVGVCVGKPNLLKCFGPKLRIWTCVLYQGQAFQKSVIKILLEENRAKILDKTYVSNFLFTCRYTLFSTAVQFLLPLCVIMFLYYQIYVYLQVKMKFKKAFT